MRSWSWPCCKWNFDAIVRQIRHRLNVYFAAVKILGLAKYWFRWKLSREITRVSKYFSLDILIETLTPDTLTPDRSNLTNRFSIYIAYRYAALKPSKPSFNWRPGCPDPGCHVCHWSARIYMMFCAGKVGTAISQFWVSGHEMLCRI